MKKIQIGVMGSAEDLNYGEDAVEFAKEIGRLIAESGNILIYGAEGEYSSISTNAAMEASKNGGITVGVTGGKYIKPYGEFEPEVIIPCGLEIGGGREFVLVRACDVIIAIGGGSGTLNEITVAYQEGIPIVTVSKFEGWAKILANTYLDDRKRLKCIKATSPKEAVEKAIESVKKVRKTTE